MKRHMWNICTLAVCVLLSLFTTAMAVAQEEEASDDPMSMWAPSAERSYPPDVEKADVTSFARWAGLSKEQREAALTLHASYSERHAAAGRKMWDYEEGLSGGDRESVWRDESMRNKLEPVREDYRKHTKKLKDEFLESIRALLTPEQEAARKWLEQRLNFRENIWTLSGAGGQAVDLVRVLEQVLPAEQTPEGAREVVNKFVAEADALVREALDLQKSANERMGALGGLEGEARDAEMKEINAWRGPMAKKAFDTMARTLERVKKALPEDQAQRLEARVYSSMIVGNIDISADRVIRRVEKLDSLTAEQKAQVGEARAAYLKVLTEKMKSQAERVVKRYEEAPDEATALAGDWGEMWQELTAQAEKVSARLREVLTAEQREAVGPPISTSKVAVPDFDSDDDAPAAKMTAAQERFARLAASWTSGPEITEFDLRRLGRAAKFSAEQAEAARELHAGYMARFRAAARKYNEFQAAAAQGNMGGMPSREDLKRQIGVWVKYDRHKDRLREDLISDMDVLLTDEQKPALDMLRAASKRKRGGEGELVMASPGAGVDLPMLVRAALRDAEPSDELAAALDRYERDMAASSGRVLELSRGVQETMLKSLEGDGEFNIMSLMTTMTQAQKELDKPLEEGREVSLKCFQQMSPLMPEEVRDEFEESFYRAAGGGRIFDMQQSAMGGGKSARGLAEEIYRLSDLSGEQTSALKAALREHGKAMRDVSKAIYERLVVKMSEAKEPMQRQMVFADGEIIQKTRERREADTKMIDRLMAILTPEQQGRLPMPYRPAGQVTRPKFEEE